MSIDAKPSLMRNDGSTTRGFRLPQSQLRLPSYRSSHSRRYHPYPRDTQHRFIDHWNLTSVSDVNDQSRNGGGGHTKRHTISGSDIDEDDISLLSLGPPQTHCTVTEQQITESLAESLADKTPERYFDLIQFVIDLVVVMRRRFMNLKDE